MKKLFLLFAAVSCSAYMAHAAAPKGYHRVNLQSVEVKDGHGEISNPVNEDGFTIPSYKDDLLDIAFSFEPTHVDLVLKNIGNSSLKIVWDDAIYVGGVNQNSIGVFHAGVKYNDRENTQLPTPVLKGARLSDIIVPKDGVSWSNYFGRWMYHFILYGENRLTQLQILLPIEYKNSTREYLFTFSVNWENVKVKKRVSGSGKCYYIKLKK
ncbi:MAG: hypothetical protein K2G66_04675 [Alistipes sp.]|nr:hypothetical protein [Alistipes sp.]MDE5906903.1 hypothetical protein [Alistipes sp.]